jgi:hypothetical protein
MSAMRFNKGILTRQPDYPVFTGFPRWPFRNRILLR